MHPETRNQKPGTVFGFWRRIAWLQLWLIFLPPLGLWMVWKEPSLSRTAKGRLIFYTYLIPFLVYVALTVYVFNSAERAIQAAGGSY
jgi:hypothetical protein